MRHALIALSLSLALTQPASAANRNAAPTPEQSAAAQAAVAAQLDAIRRLDDDPAGPRLNAVIVFDPQAGQQAAALAATGSLRGRTVLVKDNIETREWPTTAGSLAAGRQ